MTSCEVGTGVAVDLVRVDVDLDQAQVIVDAPGSEGPLDPTADADDHVGSGPHVVGAADRDEQRVRGGQHAVAHAAGRHRRPDLLGQRRHLGSRVGGARPDHDQGVLGLGQQRRCPFDRVRIVAHSPQLPRDRGSLQKDKHYG